MVRNRYPSLAFTFTALSITGYVFPQGKIKLLLLSDIMDINDFPHFLG